MEIAVTINREFLHGEITRESASKSQIIAETPAQFEQLVISGGDMSWVDSTITRKAKDLYPALHPYVSGVDHDNPASIPFLFVLSQTFDINHIPMVETSIQDILIKSVVAEWFWEKGKGELQQSLLVEVARIITGLQQVLYRWRVSRSERDNIIIETARIEHEYGVSHYLLIAIPTMMVLNHAIEDINATLKVRLSNTEEFERFTVAQSHTPLLRRVAGNNVQLIADKGQAYIDLWEENATWERLQGVINNIKRTNDPFPGGGDFFLFGFILPETFNYHSVRPAATIIHDVLVNGVMNNYFREVGLIDAAEFYFLKRENSLLDMMSLLHRRSNPIRRRANFFS